MELENDILFRFLVIWFLKKIFSITITLAFKWGIIYFCTMDGFFRILKKALSKLTCTWLYFDFLPRRLYYWYSKHIHKQNPLLWPCVLKVVYTKKENAFLTYSVGFYIQSFFPIGIITRSLEQFFLTVGQNNFGNKIPFLTVGLNIFENKIPNQEKWPNLWHGTSTFCCEEE